MKKTILGNCIIFLSILFSALLLSGCSSNNAPDAPAIEEKPSTHRTILVYMVASNNLGSGGYDFKDLAEMQEAVSNGDLNGGRLVVYHVPYSGSPRLKEITAEGIDTLATYPEDAVSVSIEQMRKVIDDTKELAPADDYGIVLWSHALGWLQDGIADAPQLRSFGQDRSRKMNITSLAQALDGHDFSFIYFDCCFMGSVEVAYELRKTTPYIIASPAEDPVEGMPYHRALKPLFSRTLDPVGAAKATYDYYMEGYEVGDCPVTYAVYSTEGIDRLAELTNYAFSQAEKPVPAGYTPQPYAEDRLCYYYDMEDYVKSLIYDEALLQQWCEAFNNVVIYRESSPWIWNTVQITRYGGLSTYILATPSASYTKGYNQLQWYQDVASSLPAEW